MNTCVFLFPGQGSQKTGMGAALADAFPAARTVFERVDTALKQPLYSLMQNGPDAQLQLTENAQPAIMAVSIATIEILEKEFSIHSHNAAFAAGHSLGEYSALCAAGSFNLETTAKLLKQRGKAMQNACPKGKGAMAALIGADMQQAENSINAGLTHGPCSIANDNAPGQIVISGSLDAINAAINSAKNNGIRRAVMLPVSAPFHSPLMQPAQELMQRKLNNLKIQTPKPAVISNITARPIQNTQDIPDLLAKQITRRVRWRESITWLNQQNHSMQFAEVGHGNILAGLNRRILPDNPPVIPLSTPQQIENFARQWHENREKK